MQRIGFLFLGWGAVALALIGVVLPGLPTTPFLIVAAYAFGKASPRARAWLVDHARLGPPIHDWEERGAISRKAKALAATMMAAIFGLSLALAVPTWALILQGLALIGAASFVLTRPD